jgi:catechol 2,3-dioxygenase-like lactoylglutathione lyase family enzyme
MHRRAAWAWGLASAALVVAVASPASAAERPPLVGVSHIAFQVSDVARARAFYGGLLGYEEAPRAGQPPSNVVRFRVNARQYIEIVPGLPAGKDERLDHVAFQTTDITALRAFLEEKGVKTAEPGLEAGSRAMRVADPDGHPVEFVQYDAGSPVARALAPGDGARRVSARILHIGLTVADAAAADRFYKDVLGFSEIWRGGRTEAVTDWINMKVPDGTDYLEYMLVSGPVDRERLGSLHHVALLVPDIQAALETVRARPGGLDPKAVRTPQVGRNRRWQLNLFDPDGSRAELMEPFTMR